jgi:hypothetical protein
MWRFFLGLFLGLCLASYAFSLEGIGHGTIVPTAFASALLAFMSDLGPIIPSLGMPLMWGLYFLVIPDIESKGKRLTVLFGVIALHVLIGIWFVIDDRSGIERAYALQRTSLVSFFVLLMISMVLLTVVSLKTASRARA